MSSSNGYQPLQTTKPLVSLSAFHGIVWAGFGLSVIVFSGRVCIRTVCFRRLLVDDWLMMVALMLLLVTAIVGQMVVEFVYDLMNAGNGDFTPGPDFLKNSQQGLRGFGISMLLCYIGIWIIKMNFLLFFHRLGSQTKRYVHFWWTVLFVTVGCGAASIGIMQFQCLFGLMATVMTTCNLPSSMSRTYTLFKISCILDVISDLFILCFPIAILWRTRVGISLRKKLILSTIFSLVVFTIAVTIVRGSIFGGVYKSIDENNMKSMNVTWIWFWFSVEFTVSFIIACLVSFRTLFTRRAKRIGAKGKEQKDRQREPPEAPLPSGIRERAKLFHESLLDTCRSLESTNDDQSDDMLSLPHPASGKPSVELSAMDGQSERPNLNDHCLESNGSVRLPTAKGGYLGNNEVTEY